MKKQSLRIFLMFGVLAILSSSAAAQAQTSDRQTARIPFAFSAGNETLPAGLYSVTRVNPQSDKTALLITSEDGRTSKFVLTTPVQGASAEGKARLVFNHYDERYCLSEVWTPASATGLELPKSRSERSLARNAREKRAERVAIALNTHRQ
jgi:hypothetical protein